MQFFYSIIWNVNTKKLLRVNKQTNKKKKKHYQSRNGKKKGLKSHVRFTELMFVTKRHGEFSVQTNFASLDFFRFLHMNI